MSTNPSSSWLYVSRPVLFRIVVLFAPLSLLLLACKVYKAYVIADELTARTVVMVAQYDIFWMLLTSLVFLFWIERSKGFFRLLGIVSAHVLAFFALLLVGLEQGYFLVSGSIIDSHLLGYIFTQRDTIGTLVANQVTLTRLPLLLFPLLVNLLPDILKLIGPLRRWLRGSRPVSSVSYKMKTVWVSLTIVLILTMIPITNKANAGQLRPLTFGFFTHMFLYSLIAPSFPDEKVAKTKANKMPLLFDARKLKLKTGPKTKKMNVVFVVLESVRSRSVTPYNPSIQTSPFLAKLAKQSLQVKTMYPVMPHTSKSIVSLHCGYFPKVTMLIDESKPGGLPGRCLPTLLKQQGYNTAFFQPATMKFEHFTQLMDNLGFDKAIGLEDLDRKGYQRINSYGYEDTIVLKPSMDWVDKSVKEKKPFFLSYLTLVTHFEYTLPKGFPTRRYSHIRDKDLFNYLNAIRYLDGFLEKLINEFKKRKLLDNTLFVIIADHGEAFGEHLRRQHDTGMWEEILKIPAWLYNPKLFPKGGTIDGPRQITDIVPTVADLLGMKLDGGKLPGTSLLKPVSPKRKLHISCTYERYCAGYIQGKMKYIYNYKRVPNEVYNLKNDPQEQNNLVKLPQHLEQLQRVLPDIMLWKARINHVYQQHAPASKKKR